MEMFSSSTEDSVNTLNLTSEKYLDILAPPQKEDEITKAAIPNPSMSLKYIRTLPLLDQIRIFVKDGKLNKFCHSFKYNNANWYGKLDKNC